ncbi:uncharacterized protein TRIADDRAFT_62466 [Trichoplax adhaerens]|uniref:Uncharacterized protein n=1 Tax=Trichoplax adhaerens TaxID=10228 RepID=B3SDW1_TRIAD|nr:hypothetical protein TRIADDRAFT_62466 [Trichoplax adhaerens]EDV19081.1 hypothetical protein TRIADDRAFT_62466 [Trichoplax adhaerens]|eukprot:XP_002118430.1 hypothetical protein TRIADDRAFT_62466 [Trichoplax adhaerens]
MANGTYFSQLCILDAKYNNKGKYILRSGLSAYNQGYDRVFNVKIKGPPKLSITLHDTKHPTINKMIHLNSSLLVNHTDDITLTCVAESFPSSIVWLNCGNRDNKNLNGIIQINDSTIQIVQASFHDSSLCYCMANNTYGNERININIIIRAPPANITDITVKNVTNTNLIIFINSDYSLLAKGLFYLIFNQAMSKPTNTTMRSQNFNVSTINYQTCHDTICKINFLQPWTTYNFWLQAVNDYGRSGNSSKIRITMKGMPISPQIIKITDNIDFVVLEWQALNLHDGTNITYSFSYKQSTSNKWLTMLITDHQEESLQKQNISVRYVHIANLTKGSSYDFKLQATNAFGTSSSQIKRLNTIGLKSGTMYNFQILSISKVGITYSEWASYKTKELPNPPRNVSVQGTVYRAAIIRWRKSNFGDDITGFAVYYRTNSSSIYDMQIVNSSEISTILTNLQYNSTYQLYIITVSIYGRSKPSKMVYFQTASLRDELYVNNSLSNTTLNYHGSNSPDGFANNDHIFAPIAATVISLLLIFLLHFLYKRYCRRPHISAPQQDVDFEDTDTQLSKSTSGVSSRSLDLTYL